MGVGGVSGVDSTRAQDQLKDAQKSDQVQQNRLDAFKSDGVQDAQREQQAREMAGVGQATANLMQELQSRQMMGSSDPQKAIDSLGLSGPQKEQAQGMASQFLNELRQTISQQMSMQSQMNSAQQQTSEEQSQVASGGAAGPASSASAMTGVGMFTDTSGGSGSDDPAVMRVIQGATGSVYAELHGMVQKMESTRLQKKALTDYISILTQAAASKSFPVKVPYYEMSFNERTGKVEMQFKGYKQMSKEEITALKEKATGIKDSLSEMTTMDQLTLQQAMEKKGQFESIFSNMLKAYQQTSQGVLSNLK